MRVALDVDTVPVVDQPVVVDALDSAIAGVFVRVDD